MLSELVSNVVTCSEIAGKAIQEISTFDNLNIVNKV